MEILYLYTGEDSVFSRWMRTEIHKINDGIVSERKFLDELLIEEKPIAKTKSGKNHFFEIDTLNKLIEILPEHIHGKLRLPILFFLDSSINDSCYVNDLIAIEALQIMGEISKIRAIRDGKIWVGKPIAYSIMKKYPSAVQIVMA